MKDFILANFGSIIVTLGLALNALVNVIRKGEDLKTVAKEVLESKRWQAEHEKESAARDAAINHLHTIAAAMEATAKGQDRRLELLEDRKKDLGY